jgi:uncharacterized protein YndB with AHSA1/START domain
MKLKSLLITAVICIAFHSCINSSAGHQHVVAAIEDTTSYTIKKIMPVSPEKVYAAYLDPQSLKQIWSLDSIRLDVRPEGQTKGYLTFDDVNWDFTFTYQEVIPNQKLSWVMRYSKHPKIEVRTTIVFNSIKEGTEVSFSQENFKTKAERDDNRWANGEALNNMSSLLVKL